MTDENTKEGLAEIIERGGIYRDIRGASPRELLSCLIEASLRKASLPGIASVSGGALLEAVLEREALMSTGIGKGIALPHPRNPILPSGQFAALAFLECPAEWNSLDGEKVNTLLLIVSSSARQHLHTLSEINFLCRQDDFCDLLKKRAGEDELFAFIRETEKRWIGPV
jgi:PTS system nitrogen regulatory IIA component